MFCASMILNQQMSCERNGTRMARSIIWSSRKESQVLRGRGNGDVVRNICVHIVGLASAWTLAC